MTVSTSEIVQTLMRQRDRLYAYLWGMIGDPQLADDALQELYLLAVEKSSEIADVEHLTAWLRRAARLKGLEAMRTRGRLPRNLTDEVLEQCEAYWASQDAVGDASMMQALRQCIQRQSTANQTLLTLRYVEGKKAGDIAQLQNRRVEAVYKALFRVHSQLRDCIQHRLREAALHD